MNNLNPKESGFNWSLDFQNEIMFALTNHVLI